MNKGYSWAFIWKFMVSCQHCTFFFWDNFPNKPEMRALLVFPLVKGFVCMLINFCQFVVAWRAGTIPQWLPPYTPEAKLSVKKKNL